MESNVRPEPLDSYDNRLVSLMQELELAFKWDRPSILLVVYVSEITRTEVEQEIERRLEPLGQTVIRFKVDEKHWDVPALLAEQPTRVPTVFFVSGLKWGGGADGDNAYRALNYRREYFVERRLRVVFWLTEQEGVALPNRAPDFWAFRHHTIEFPELPALEKAMARARELAWEGFDDRSLRQDTEAKIALGKALLADLPKGDETLVARADLLYTLGGLTWTKGDFPVAIIRFEKSLELAQRAGDIRLQAFCMNGLGNVYDERGQAEDALAAYQKAIELDPIIAAPYNGLGNVYADLGQAKDALTAYRRAIELDPKYAYPYNGMGVLYRDLGQAEDALAAYQKAIELDPKDAYPYFGLGNVFRDLGREEDALAAYQKAIEFDSKWPYPYNGLGNVFHDLGRVEDALAAYQKAIELDPNSSALYNSLGNVYLDLGRTEDALAAYQKAIELDPNHAAPYHGLGNVYDKIEWAEDALVAYQKANELDPEWAYPYHGLGNVYDELGRAEDALAAYQKAIELDPKDAYPYNGLGNVYARLGRVENALAVFQKAIALAPMNALYHKNLGVALQTLGKLDKALVEFERVVELETQNAAHLISIAGLLRRMGRDTEAEEKFRAAQGLLEKESEYNRACFAALTGDLGTALTLLKAAFEKKQASPAWASRDPDLESLHGDPRFQALISQEIKE